MFRALRKNVDPTNYFGLIPILYIKNVTMYLLVIHFELGFWDNVKINTFWTLTMSSKDDGGKNGIRKHENRRRTTASRG